MSLEDVFKVEDDKHRANEIWKATADIRSYCSYRSIIDIGVTIGLNDLPFERAMLYSWIKEEIDSDRKTRI